MTSTTFVTGNAQKASYFSQRIGLEVPHHAADLDEIQTLDHRELVGHKVHQAYSQLQRPVLVEDVFFSFEALGDLPGPFVKFFVDADNGHEKMCRLLDGFNNRRARATCVFGHYDGEVLEFFSGHIDGTIARSPRGEGGYGFDSTFEPDGFGGKTAAELSSDEYDRYYAAIKPFTAVGEFLKAQV